MKTTKVKIELEIEDAENMEEYELKELVHEYLRELMEDDSLHYEIV